MTKHTNLTERVIRTYELEGKVLGNVYEVPRYEFPAEDFRKVVVKRGREFRPEPGINEFDIVDLIEDLSPSERVHLKTSVYPLYRLLEHFNLNPDDYVSDEDAMIHIADRGYKNLTELNRSDFRAWELVNQRKLEEQLFSGSQS